MQTRNSYVIHTMTTDNASEQMNFTDLIPGRVYRLSFSGILRNNNTNSNTEETFILAHHDGVDIMECLYRSQADSVTNNETLNLMAEYIFKATTTSVTFTDASSGVNSEVFATIGNATTFAILELLNNYEETTAFT